MYHHSSYNTSRSTKLQDSRNSARGHSLRSRNERLQNILETYKLARECQDAGFTIIVVKGKYCMTRSALRWQNRTSPTRVESTSTVAISNWRARKVYLETTQQLDLFWMYCQITVWPLRNEGQNWFICRRWIKVLGRHQQGVLNLR